MDNKSVALRSGYYFMIFDINDIPFFNELKKTSTKVLKDGIIYDVYTAPTWEIAQKIDAFMGNDSLGFELDDYLLNEKNMKV